MSYRGVLSDEELEYLQTLLHTTDDAPIRDARFTLQGSDKGTTLLKTLAADHELTLEARSDKVHVRFALGFTTDSLGNLQLSLQTPRLTEMGPTPRAWRAVFAEALKLKTQDQTHAFDLIELSASGAVLEFHAAPPKYCEFLLPLASLDIALKAKCVRHLGRTRAAYRIFTARPSDLERLRTYLYYLYQRQRQLP